MADKGVRVTVLDLETGDEESREIVDDYIVVTAGQHYVSYVNTFANGTTNITIKREA